ncbi:hypothetical protein [Rhizobium bangladeshense]|uniref:hypothetical protein n=1 Tax=Rhizobium bangladeshense TaxID=1138189 RepID=UPI000AB44BCF|nr:hypothetical protein [Rhizobium bangladeshense]MBX4897078.1 hypothetical protein [Rhizobium bangladeshense]MBX4900883.1 hypothetical protein [Rhizobium bangladeshense]MBY3614252.1 hypothetical protein [Rhizobium bangladeshense]
MDQVQAAAVLADCTALAIDAASAKGGQLTVEERGRMAIPVAAANALAITAVASGTGRILADQVSIRLGKGATL